MVFQFRQRPHVIIFTLGNAGIGLEGHLRKGFKVGCLVLCLGCRGGVDNQHMTSLACGFPALDSHFFGKVE